MKTNDGLKKLFLEYEVYSSWFAGFIGSKFLQEVSAKYFAWKVNRKFNSYLKRKAIQKLILENR